MMKSKKRFVIIIAIAAFTSIALAILIPLKAEDSQKNKRTAGIVDVVRIWKLTNDLSLSIEQLKSFYPKFHQMEELRGRYLAEKGEALEKLKNLDENANASEAELQTALNEFYEIEDNFARNLKALRDELNSQLTLRQQVKFAISNATFRRDVRRVLIKLKELGASKKQPLLIRTVDSK